MKCIEIEGDRIEKQKSFKT